MLSIDEWRSGQEPSAGVWVRLLILNTGFVHTSGFQSTLSCEDNLASGTWVDPLNPVKPKSQNPGWPSSVNTTALLLTHYLQPPWV